MYCKSVPLLNRYSARCLLLVACCLLLVACCLLLVAVLLRICYKGTAASTRCITTGDIFSSTLDLAANFP